MIRDSVLLRRVDSVAFSDSVILGDPDADAILRALRQAGSAGLSRTEISNLFGRHRSAAKIERALAFLLQRGKAKCLKQSSGGRPSEKWIAT